MQDHEQQIIHLYMAVNGLLSVLSLIMYLVCAYVVLANGRASTERTLIGMGAVLQVMGVVLSLSVTLLPNLLNVTPGQYGLIFYTISNVISFAGTALGLFGAVKLLNRVSQMELLLQDPDDDR